VTRLWLRAAGAGRHCAPTALIGRSRAAPSTSPLGGCSPCRARSLRSRTAAASSAKILPIELWRCDMKDHGSGDVRFSEALALWLPGAFSLALMAFHWSISSRFLIFRFLGTRQ